VIFSLRQAIQSIVVIVSLLTARLAHAECVIVTAKELMDGKLYELVFSGTRVGITRTEDVGYWATFEVDRVWKGSVSKRFDLYVWELAPEIPQFEMGRHHLVAAQRLTDPRARQGTGLSGSDRVRVHARSM
jgi:hypothetical protein